MPKWFVATELTRPKSS